MTLAEFLLARIAEDEARANDPCAPYAMHWPECDYPGDMPGYCTCDLRVRVLAECEAKRAIVKLHQAYAHPQEMIYGTITACSTCGNVDDSPVEWPCDTLRAFAAVYAAHPDCRAEWRP